MPLVVRAACRCSPTRAFPGRLRGVGGGAPGGGSAPALQGIHPFPYQLHQARAAGADAALLIAAILTDQDVVYLIKVARALGLAVLVEVHDTEELERMLRLPLWSEPSTAAHILIGINNRDLTSFHTDLATTEQLMARCGDQLRQRGRCW